MTDIYSLKQPLFSETEALLKRIAQTCAEPKIDFFVAGATTREVILTHQHGRKSGRHTRDIDIAIFIRGLTLSGTNTHLKGQFAGLEYVGVIHNGMAFWLTGFGRERF